ncbi:amidohydrolase/deacetylase family metallohydrolase [Aureimonas glaciei]|uniref:Deacetylase n=1 Tax=Aureimonas glaciei TaxID=1776957 RepID=A0A917DEF6_9HYPH|nr:amidohydrolase/deacetylase family metallohydrolase [Aureimonas glaciei]GGD33517.1 deacetylase [Aureimonas glaciei]
MEASPILLRNVRPVAFGPGTAPGAIDIAIGADGLIKATGPSLIPVPGARIVDGENAFVSPGWTDLHAHVWHGGTDISIRPKQAGLERGVTTIVDAGSAGEATFHGFREYIIDKADERILAFLNIGSIGLVACNRVSELIDIRSIDIDRTIAVVEANRDLIVGIKCRASHVILGSWGITPVKIAKKVAKILKLPMMIHVGEPPPTYDEVLELLRPGDIITHCFNGKAGGSIIEDEDLWDLVNKCADQGIRLDVGHGGASFSFKVAEVAIARGLMPFSISTDLHDHSLNGPVWDMATTMSKLLAVGMPFEAVVKASTTAPMSAVKLPTEDLLAVGKKAELTLFDLVGSDLAVRDSQGAVSTLKQMFEPRWAVMGSKLVKAARHMPKEGMAKICTCGAHP